MSMMTIQDVMKELQISRKTFYNWKDNGLPVYKIGRLVRVDRNELHDWIKKGGK